MIIDHEYQNDEILQIDARFILDFNEELEPSKLLFISPSHIRAALGLSFSAYSKD